MNTELEILLRIEDSLNRLGNVLEGMYNPVVTDIKSKWLTEHEVMTILNTTKRGMEKIRAKQVIRTSTPSGRNHKYYRPDVEKYLYDNSAVRKPSLK